MSSSTKIDIDINTIIRDLIDLGISEDKKIIKYIKERFGISYENIAIYLVPKIIAYQKMATAGDSAVYYANILKRFKNILNLCMELA